MLKHVKTVSYLVESELWYDWFKLV
jgi:hypothetical protein